MTFLSPEYFWLLLFLVPVFIKKNFRTLHFVSYGYILTFLLITLALTRVVIEEEPLKSEEILSDVIIAVDLSYSMQATDVKPTRLAKAKELLKTLVEEKPRTRFGVLGFTSNAIVLSPLTQDSELLLHLFEALDEKLIITRGSAVLPALELARKMSQSKKVTVVLLSDGGDASSYDKEALFAKENHMVVNVMMLASQLGATLTLEDGSLLKDENGDIVVSRKNDAIATIARATGGVYTQDIQNIKEALEEQKNSDIKSQTTVVRNIELFYYFVVLALLVFLVTTTTLKRFVIAFLLLFGITLNADVSQFFENENRVEFKKASNYYRAGEYEKALESYERVRSSDVVFKSVIYYNIANTLVRLKEFKKAKEAYLKSLTLNYSKEADENLQYIWDVDEQKQMKTGQQKTEKNSSFAKQEQTSKKKQEGGGSNMKVSANASNAKSDMSKKTQSDAMLNLNSGRAKLSSKQYELINKRGVNEKQPW